MGEEAKQVRLLISLSFGFFGAAFYFNPYWLFFICIWQEQAKAEAKPGEKKEEKAEEKKEEKAQEKKEEEPKPPAPFVLYVDLHCAGCAKKIEKSIMKIRGPPPPLSPFLFVNCYLCFCFSMLVYVSICVYIDSCQDTTKINRIFELALKIFQTTYRGRLMYQLVD